MPKGRHQTRPASVAANLKWFEVLRKPAVDEGDAPASRLRIQCPSSSSEDDHKTHLTPLHRSARRVSPSLLASWAEPESGDRLGGSVTVAELVDRAAGRESRIAVPGVATGRPASSRVKGEDRADAARRHVVTAREPGHVDRAAPGLDASESNPRESWWLVSSRTARAHPVATARGALRRRTPRRPIRGCRGCCQYPDSYLRTRAVGRPAWRRNRDTSVLRRCFRPVSPAVPPTVRVLAMEFMPFQLSPVGSSSDHLRGV